jgi:tetratricopeptide (TPR) repeat protein
MHLKYFHALVLAACLLGAPAIARGDDPDVTGCESATDADKDIAFCSSVIRSGKFAGTKLAWAYFDRGDAYYQKGDLTAALSDFNKAIELKPDYQHAYRERGDLYYDMGKKDQALADYNEAIRLNPEDPVVLTSRGWLYQLQGKPDLAMQDYNAAVEAEPENARARNNRCWAYLGLGKLEEAAADCDLALVSDPDNAYSLDSRAWVYLRAGDDASAETMFRRAIGIDEKMGSSFYGLGVIEQHRGNQTEAEKDFAAARSAMAGIEDLLAKQHVWPP